jgi:very-short-patch-repair endonuclease
VQVRAEVALERLGGVADRHRLAALVGAPAVRRAIRRGAVVQVARGRYVLPTTDEARVAAGRLSGVVSHLSAASALGWELKNQPDRAQVSVPRHRKVGPERRQEDVVWFTDLRPEEVHGGVTTPGRTVMDCARTLPFDEALAVADSALRHRCLTHARLLQLAELVPPRYRPRCRRVAQHADGRAANPFESVLRAQALDAGLDVTPQVVLVLGAARVRPDLVDESRRLVLEADSFEFHGRRRDLLRDCERYNALTLHGWTVLRLGWEHVMLHPHYVADLLGDARAGRGVPAA